jgi:hypothetical protein
MTKDQRPIDRQRCRLTALSRRRNGLTTVVTHPVFGQETSDGRMLEVPAQMLAAHLDGDITRYVGFAVR